MPEKTKLVKEEMQSETPYKLSWKLTLILAAFNLFLGDPAKAQEATLESPPSMIAYIPLGFCEFKTSNRELARKHQTQQSLGNSVELLAMFAPCQEVAAFNSAETEVFSKWGFVSLPKLSGRYFSVSSRALLVGRARSAATEDGNDTTDRIERRLKRQLREQVAIEPFISGLLAVDDAAYYGEMESVADSSGKIGTVLGVRAYSATRGAVVVYSVYEFATASSSYAALLELQRRNVAGLILTNE